MHYLLLVLTFSAAQAARYSTLFNDGWLFYKGDLPNYSCSSPESAVIFPLNLSNTMVHGLDNNPQGNASSSACQALCASNCSCQVWQYCSKLLTPTLCGDSSTSSSSSSCSNDTQSFPFEYNDVQCNGLSGASASNEAECAAACCSDNTCEIYQWCPPGSSSSSCGPPSSCWIGQLDGAVCKQEDGWISRARNVTYGATCQTGLLADYGPGSWQTTNTGPWISGARLQPPSPPYQSSGPGALIYDEQLFEPIMLPHDYLAFVAPTDINSTFHQNEHGSIPFSNAWYRRHFTVPEGTLLVRIDFDGAYRSASVFINGALAAQHEEGYTGFGVWLHNVTNGPLNIGGGDNVIAVFLASTIYSYELWGYEGSGIERDITLTFFDSAQTIVPWGVFVPSMLTGPVLAPEGACGFQSAPALVSPTIDVANAATITSLIEVLSQVVSLTGEVVGSTTIQTSLSAGEFARLSPPPITLSSAALWSPACTPDASIRPLYTLVTTLSDSSSGKVLDSTNTSFGIRNATFDANKGLLINGFQTKIRGVSMHQDFAGVGTFVPPNIQAYRVQRILDIGGNGWRTAHNPVDSNLLDVTDRRGVLVWDETRFLRDFDNYISDAGDMVARDRNHPSVILYSLCNENGCGETDGWEGSLSEDIQPGAMLATKFMSHMKTIDPTRPITSNAHYTLGQNGSIMSVVDVMGLTYDYDSLAKMHSQRPDTPLLNGESSSCQSDRGDDDVSGVIGCSRDAWATADQNEWDIGAFSWSGTDYRGECGGWPQTVSYYGILDICGFEKGVSIWYQVWWGLAAGWPNISSLVKAWPPWSGTEGSNVKITAVAAAASLQLAVNGIAQGEPVSLSHLSFATWSVPFSPGNYSITSFDSNGAVLGYVVSQSSGSANALLAQVDWQGSGPQGELLAGQRDAALIVISVIDSNGIVVRSANLNITVTVTGPGELLGLGNGDHLNHLPGQGITTMPAYKGFLRAIVRSGQSATGAPVVVTASADGLVGTFIEIDVV